MPLEPQGDELDSTKSFRMLSPGASISHYKIVEKIGTGGMGVVYKSQDTRLGRTVALKFLPSQLICDAEVKARFEHEAKAASALNHANITTVYEIDEVEGQCFISMEYIEGKSIKELLKEKTLSADEVLGIALQIGEGLNAAHKKDIVHRDVKSDNIMLTDEGVVKIMDFGLAKLKGVTKLTKTGTTMGTLQYMSPEQAQGMEVDQRSDIFSFGVILYEMITGQLPFKGEHEAAIIYSILNETPDPLARYKANVPEGLQRIVDKALQKDVSTRYQSAAEVVADLKGLQKETTVVIAAKHKRRLLPFLVPASIIFIIVLLLLILKPFRLEIVSDKSAVAKENSLAIMYFDNLVDAEDEERLGEIVTNLLITDLSESEYMRVVSSQRLYDILKLLGREGEKKIDREVATQVATKAGARWMLFGSVLQVEPEIVLTSQLVDVGSGKVTASQRITGEAGEKIFSMVDKLTGEIKNDLSLPAVAQQEPDPSVADITTHSPEAYRYYLEGLDYTSKYYSTEAERSFRKALEFDSTFAMAYLRLSMEWPDDWKELLAKAVEYSDDVTHKEKCYIKVQEARVSDYETQYVKELKKLVERYPDEKDAFFMLGVYYQGWGKFEEAVSQLNKAIEIDPLYKLPYNTLAYTYHELGDFDKSIWAINKYISIAPDEANPYDSRADLYAYNGRIDQAIESYKRALEIKPDFYASLLKLGHMYLFKREYAKAESCYQATASHSDKWYRSVGRFLLAHIPAYQGKFETALKVLDDGIAADRMEQTEDRAVDKLLNKAHIFACKKDLNSALREVEIAMEINERLRPEYVQRPFPIYARLLAENGDFEKAEEAASALRKNIEEKDQTQMDTYWWLLGNIELAKGDAKTAVTYMEKATKETKWWSFGHRFCLGRAYLESGRLGESVAQLEKALRCYDEGRLLYPIWEVEAYYLLGLAYEKSGWNEKAIEQFEEFLEIWKDADPGIPEVEDAKKRLARLKSKA
jgi:serine/threonine protein kinase/tetratricopeptide (TPR) repeat protein